MPVQGSQKSKSRDILTVRPIVYRDLFIDMAVRNNRSELAIANRHQERGNFTR